MNQLFFPRARRAFHPHNNKTKARITWNISLRLSFTVFWVRKEEHKGWTRCEKKKEKKVRNWMWREKTNLWCWCCLVKVHIDPKCFSRAKIQNKTTGKLHENHIYELMRYGCKLYFYCNFIPDLLLGQFTMSAKKRNRKGWKWHKAPSRRHSRVWKRYLKQLFFRHETSTWQSCL